ncbi:MAG: hypothetical protein KJ051_09045 [Thermoleophilia bacterium]|nr:hypothetical protein [Thermoleophilia bacterium]
MFIVQTAIGAEPGSRHATLDEAIVATEGLIREGVAEPGEFSVREIDGARRTVREIEVEPAGGVA